MGSVNTHGVGKIGNFRLELPFILETVRDRPVVGCYITLIGSRTQPIGMCLFQ